MIMVLICLVCVFVNLVWLTTDPWDRFASIALGYSLAHTVTSISSLWRVL